MLRCQHQWLAVVDVHHALIAGGSDDHKSVAVVEIQARMSLGECAKEHGLLTLKANEIGLLSSRIVRVFDPLIPPFTRHQGSAIRPKLLEEPSRGDRLYACVNRVRALALGPKRRPSPFDCIDMRAIFCGVQQLHRCRRSDVVAIDWLSVVTAEQLYL